MDTPPPDFPYEAFAYPLALLLLGLVALIVFKGPLTRFIDRTKRVGKDGIDASERAKEVTVEQQVAIEAKPSAPLPAPTMHMPPADEALAPVEQEINATLAKVGAAPEVDRAWLIRTVAQLRVARAHDEFHSHIFGSQITLILDSNKAGGCSQQRAQELYNAAAAKYPDLYKDWTFDGWTNYPLIRGIISRGADEDGKPLYSITPLGRNFLHYLIHTGKTDPRYG